MEIIAIHRYPVKSMQGEALSEATVDRHGIVGDRSHALQDEATGVVLTGRLDPPLLFATGRLDGVDNSGRAQVVRPDGSVAADDAAISAWLGRPVRLVGPADDPSTYEIAVDPFDDGSEVTSWQGPTGSYHDSGRTQVSIIATGDVSGWDLRRFRANVVIDAPTADDLIGGRYRLGSAELEVVKQISRCVMVTRPQPGGIERDLDVLRTINRERDNCLAVGALVTNPGTFRRGDRLEPMDT